MPMKQFKDLELFFAGAETEAEENPDLLQYGYLDRWRTDRYIVAGSKFLVLGHKGSGKSAIAEHLRLRSKSDPILFVRTLKFETHFDFGRFADLAGPMGEGQPGYVVCWRWLILLQILQSFSEDEDAMSDLQAANAIQALRAINLLPAESFRSTVTASRKRSVTIGIPKMRLPRNCRT